ncbi:MAG TPA: hypothetical protein VLJ59_04360 [Mycobacteriales bacterium]|nr:hypothetical protein [Mycobacteriales bacterium]
MNEFRVATKMRAEGRLLVVLACGLMAFAAYFVVGVLRGGLSTPHLVIAVLSVLVAGLTIWSQQRGPVLLAATPEHLVVMHEHGTTTYRWDEVSRVALVANGPAALAVTLYGARAPMLVPLDRAALAPIEVLHGVRTIAPEHIAGTPRN